MTTGAMISLAPTFVDPMADDEDYGGATVATITLDDPSFAAHPRVKGTLEDHPAANDGDWRGGDTLRDAKVAAPRADVNAVAYPTPARADDEPHALDDLDLFHQASIDGDEDTWDVLLGAFQEHCRDAGGVNRNIDSTINPTPTDHRGSFSHPPPRPTSPSNFLAIRHPRSSSSTLNSSGESAKDERAGINSDLPSSDECDAGSTSTPRALVRTEAITADLDDALRRWSVNKEIPRSDAPAPATAHTNRGVIGVNFGDPLSYDCEADLNYGGEDVNPDPEFAFDDVAFPFDETARPQPFHTGHHVKAAEHVSTVVERSSPDQLITTDAGKGHASHVLRSLIFGKGELRRGKCTVAPRGRTSGKPNARTGKRGRRGSSKANNIRGFPDQRTRAARDDLTGDGTDDEETIAAYPERDPLRWAASVDVTATSSAMDADVSSTIHVATQAGVSSVQIAGMTRDLRSLRDGIAEELATLSQTEARTVRAAQAADARAERVNHHGLFDDNSLNDGSTLNATRQSVAAVARLRFRECRFRILRQFERDVRACLTSHCGGASVMDTGRGHLEHCADDSPYVGSLHDSPHMSSGTLSDPRETRAAGTLSRKHSQTLTQLARDAPSSALARKRVLPNTKGDLTEDLQQVTSNKAGKSPASRLKKQPFKRGGDASSKRRPNLTARKQHSDRATEVLERWFWDNFYPTEQRPKPVPTRDEKLSLAAATGLSERQVADWFVNARARKWKPRMEAIMREVCGEMEPTEGEVGPAE